jgi:phage gp36-like protein
MAYSTDEDIFDRLSEQKVRELTDDHGSGSVDTQRLSRLRDQAARKIDIYVRRQYELPITDTDALQVLADIEVDLLAYLLYARRPLDIPEDVEAQREQAMDDLNMIAEDGGLGIDQDGDGTPDGGSSLRVRSGDDRQTFTERMDGRY